MSCASLSRAVCLAAFTLAVAGVWAVAEETNATASALVPRADEAITNTDALRSYLQLQEQLHNTQLALERNREESERLAARNAEALAARLQLIEQAVSTQRARDLEALQNANRLLLIIAGSFAGVGFVAMLLTAYLQWRAVNRLAEFSALLPAASRATLPLALPEPAMVGAGAAEQSNARLFGALGRLEKRILELEHTTQLQPPADGAEGKTVTPPHSGPTADGATSATGSGAAPVTTDKNDHIALLLAKGQSLLNLDKATEALDCFNEILAQQPKHPEALVKKGIALEQLRQIDEALRCYDNAIAADESLTIAYLQKGGLFNRLERYEEALRCYEAALRSQEKDRET